MAGWGYASIHSGQSQEAVKDRLGHKSIKSTDVYAKISSHKRDLVSREMERASERDRYFVLKKDYKLQNRYFLFKCARCTSIKKAGISRSAYYRIIHEEK